MSLALAAILLAQPLLAADREVIHTDWNGFRQQVSSRKLEGRPAQIRLSGGSDIKTTLLEGTDAALVVRANRATQQWKSADGKAHIPKDQVASVRFGGRSGKRGILGGLIGLGAGAGIGAAIATGHDITEGSLVVILPVVAVGVAIGCGLAGYFIGRSMDRPAPEFVLTR